MIGLLLYGIYAFDDRGIYDSQSDVPSYYEDGVKKYLRGEGCAFYRAGDRIITDVDGNGQVYYYGTLAEDRVYIGSSLPQFQGGISTDLRWKGLDVTMLFNFVCRKWVLDAAQGASLGTYLELNPADMARPYLMGSLNGLFWEHPGGDAPYPANRMENGLYNFATNLASNAQRISYLKLQAVMVGYTLPEAVRKATGFGARIFVSAANLVIGNLYRAGLPEERYRFYMGQALCIRAYLYFQIIRLWGDAPLVLEYEDISEKGRTPWREIARHIVEDLLLAAEYLPPADQLKDSEGKPLTARQIPGRGTAYAILAEVYAWIAGYGQEPEYYALGIEAAGKVIGDSAYRLVASPEVLPGNSEEGIFEVCYDDSRGEYEDFGSYIGGTVEKWPVLKGTTPASRRKFFIRNETVESLYTLEDLRLQAYFADFFRMKEEPVSVTQGAAYVRMWREVEYYSGGIYDGTLRTLLANDILIRLPDILLLRAEMKAVTGDREGAVADLEVVRRRAGVAGYSEAKGDLRRAIQLERDKELLFQTGVRYFDYMCNQTYNLLKGGFRDLTEADVAVGALFLPVSLDAMNNNPKVKQTAYWVGKF